MELKTLYFNFDSPLQKRFLRSISRKTTNYWNLSAWWAYGFVNLRAVSVSQLIMPVNKPKVEYKLVQLYS